MTDTPDTEGETSAVQPPTIEALVGVLSTIAEIQNALRQENIRLNGVVEQLAEEVAQLRSHLASVPGTVERAAKAEVGVQIDSKIKELERLWRRRKE